MTWWTENLPLVVGVIGSTLAAGLAVWVLRRPFWGSRKPPQQRQDSGAESWKAQANQADPVTVTRPSWLRGRTRPWSPDHPRAGTSGGKLLKRGLGIAAGALIIGGMLYAIALLAGVPVTALPTPLVFAVAGSVVALGILILGVRLLGRIAMRRRAQQLGVRAGSTASSYEKSLVLFIDPAEALSHSRAALLALGKGAELDSDAERPDEVVGRTSRSERSFGEIIRVRVRRTMMGHAQVEIQSRPAVWQLFDGGINAENVAAIARYLEARASPVEKQRPREQGPARESSLFTIADWLALGYLAGLAGYTGTVIALKMHWPGTYAAWVAWLDAVPLDPLRLLGQSCPTGGRATDAPVVLQLNILILPTLVAYSAYNTIEFRKKRDRMDATNWLLCLGSLIFLPLLVLAGCSPDWVADVTVKYRGLTGFILENDAGGAGYALLLVIFANGVSYLPALVLVRVLGRKSEE